MKQLISTQTLEERLASQPVHKKNEIVPNRIEQDKLKKLLFNKNNGVVYV